MLLWAVRDLSSKEETPDACSNAAPTVNFRPITVLKTNYKILKKLLGSKQNPLIMKSVCASQKGCLPKRNMFMIATRYVTAHKDETQETRGIFYMNFNVLDPSRQMPE